MASLFCLLLIFAAESWAAITVKVDRSSISEDESFYIEFHSDADVDGDPDFRPLERDFRVINTNQSSSMSIINGKVSRNITWTIMVMAKRSGNFSIPSIRFGSDRTKPVSIHIAKARKASGKRGESALFIEAETDSKSVYIQAQLLYTVRVYTSINLLNASLPEPTFTSGEAVIEKFDNEASFEKIINNRRYKVFEKRYAMFPQKSGTLTIGGVEFNGQYVDRRRALRTKVLRADPIQIKVKPKPAATAGSNLWLPAQKVQIREEWPNDPPQFVMGTPLTRTLTIAANGLTSSQLPSLGTQSNKDMKFYPDNPEFRDNKNDKGIVGIRQEKVAMIPTKTGEFELPAIEIPWWNTKKDKLEYATIPARKILVQAAAVSSITPQALSATESEAVPLGQIPEQSDTGAVSDFWRWLAILATAAWLLTALAWWRKSLQGKQSLSVQDRPSKNCDGLLKKVKEQARQNKAPATKDALLKWGQCYLDERPGNLLELGRSCGGEFEKCLQQLGKALYSSNGETWRGDALLKVLADFKPPKQNSDLAEKNGDIMPLHVIVNRS